MIFTMSPYTRIAQWGRCVSRALLIAASALCIGLVFAPMPAQAQGILKGSPTASSGGVIGPGMPLAGGAPGCSITITRGEDLLGPPCAFSCKTLNLDYQSQCTQMDNNTFYCGDKNKRAVPCGSAEVDCEIYKGKPSHGQSFNVVFPDDHPKCASLKGDPHLKTFDDLRYDFQTAGEFIAARSLDDNMQVQVRMEPYAPIYDFLTVGTAVAAQVGERRIMIAARTGTPLRIDGEPFDLPEGEAMALDDEGSLILHRAWENRARRVSGYTVVWPDGTNLHVEIFPEWLTDMNILLAKARDGRVEGIGGDADGDDGANDFKTRDGKALESPPEFDVLYGEFAESWRITQQESLFYYEDGETTETFTDRAYPARAVRIDDLDADARADAERRCRDGGVVEPEALENCIFDVASTGDDIFITSAFGGQTPPELRDPDASEDAPEGVQIDAPASGLAAHSIEVGIRGHEKSFWFGFAPAGSGPDGRAGTYSDVYLSGDEETLMLAIPPIPGTYELRYRESSGALTTVASQPFEVMTPQVEIEAPATAEAGGSLDFRVSGDLGEHMTVTIVPAGSPDAQKSTLFYYVVQGEREASSTFNGLPETPGDYEIRCVSDWEAGVIYARQAVTIE